MPLNHISFLFLVMCSFCDANAQKKPPSTDTPQYKFDTVLKGGYALTFKTDDSLQYLYLHKGTSFKLLSKEEKYQPQQLLGIIAADFKDYFVLAHTLHIINADDPIAFELYKKTTADKALQGFYVNASVINNVILMYNNASNGLILYNVVMKTSELFPFPETNIGNEPRLINRIRIKVISQHTLMVTYLPSVDAAEKVKIYKR